MSTTLLRTCVCRACLGVRAPASVCVCACLGVRARVRACAPAFPCASHGQPGSLSDACGELVLRFLGCAPTAEDLVSLVGPSFAAARSGRAPNSGAGRLLTLSLGQAVFDIKNPHLRPPRNESEPEPVVWDLRIFFFSFVRAHADVLRPRLWL